MGAVAFTLVALCALPAAGAELPPARRGSVWSSAWGPSGLALCFRNGSDYVSPQAPVAWFTERRILPCWEVLSVWASQCNRKTGSVEAVLCEGHVGKRGPEAQQGELGQIRGSRTIAGSEFCSPGPWGGDATGLDW